MITTLLITLLSLIKGCPGHALKESETWRMADHSKKNPGYYHKISSAETITICLIEIIALFVSLQWLAIPYIALLNVCGIILHEFLFNQKSHGDGKFYKSGGGKIGKITIKYPKGHTMIIIFILCVFGALIILF